MVEDISLNKEYAIYANNNVVDYQTDYDKLLDETNVLRLNTYQSFIVNLFDPSTTFNKLLLIHGTGTGKTITSLAVAKEYIDQYKLSKGSDIKNIIILGFTHAIFKRELLSHSEFGFISAAELSELKQLEIDAQDNVNIRKKIDDLKKSYIRRLKKKQNTGIFKFYGYKQLFLNIINNQQITDLIESNKLSKNPSIGELRTLIKSGKLEVNYDIIDDFKNSLIICDEIHNIYNSEEQNSWGLALELIIDYFNDPLKKDKAIYNSIRLLYLSATPLTSSPKEIIPIINLLNNKEDRVNESDIFTNNSIEISNKSTLLIKSKLINKISYVMDDNPEQYPRSLFVGENIKQIKYLKFNRCPISEYHLNTYKQYWNKETHEATNISNNTITDIVLPNNKSTKFGIYDSDEFLNMIDSENNDVTNKLMIGKDIDGNITGDFLLNENLEKYSSKYYHILNLLLKLKPNTSGKVFLYHPLVVGVGVKLLGNILSRNGFLNEVESPGMHSLCMDCDKLYKDHKNITDHRFKPIRYIMITGYIGKTNINKLLEAFNKSSNINGDEIKILIGSRTMRESHTLKAVQHLIISHCPNSISELIQIIGRGVRKNSHIELPYENRKTNIYIFTNSFKDKKLLSPEEEVYNNKITNYLQINKIENIMFNISIDYLINFRFKISNEEKLIGDVFDINTQRHKKYVSDLISVKKLKTYTFNAFFVEDEITNIKYIIKRIFLEYQQILTYDIMFKLVKSPPFKIELNTSLFNEDNFIIALNDIIYSEYDLNILYNKTYNTYDFYNNLHNKYDKLIIAPNKRKFIIYQHQNIYILYDLNEFKLNGFNVDMITHEFNTDIKSIDNVDLKYLSEHINDLIDPSVLLDEIDKSSYVHISDSRILNGLTINTHQSLLEYIIEQIWSTLFSSKTNLSKSMKTTIIDIIKYYRDNKMLIQIMDLKFSIVENIYKKYIINNGVPWETALIKSTKLINLMSLPVGHYINNYPRLIKPDNHATWVEYISIISKPKWVYKLSLIGFEIKESNSMELGFKVKFLNDSTSKGINCTFLQKSKLQSICKEIGITYNTSENKLDTCERIKTQLYKLELNERKKNSNIKYYFQFYEQLVE